MEITSSNICVLESVLENTKKEDETILESIRNNNNFELRNSGQYLHVRWVPEEFVLQGD